MTKKLKTVLNKKKRAFYSSDLLEKKNVEREVKNEIRKAKTEYKKKIEMQFSSNNMRAAWQGIKAMACIDHHISVAKDPTRITGVDNTDLPNCFNSFFSRFERPDIAHDVSRVRNSLVPHKSLSISQDHVAALFKRTNIRKAAGPDAICGRTLHHCADQLSGVFSKIFQLCADGCVLPSLWKSSTIMPIPKLKKASDINDFRPVALTSLIMKHFERILKD